MEMMGFRCGTDGVDLRGFWSGTEGGTFGDRDFGPKPGFRSGPGMYPWPRPSLYLNKSSSMYPYENSKFLIDFGRLVNIQSETIFSNFIFTFQFFKIFKGCITKPLSKSFKNYEESL